MHRINIYVCDCTYTHINKHKQLAFFKEIIKIIVFIAYMDKDQH